MYEDITEQNRTETLLTRNIQYIYNTY